MDNGAMLLWIRIDSRAKRRGTLLALYISYLAICLFSARARSSSGFLLWADVTAICIAGVIFAASWAALVRLVREYGFPGDLRLFTSRDERQTSVRHGSFIRAYSMMTILIGGACVYYMLSQTVGLWLPGPQYSKPMLFGLILLVTTLPAAITAWSEPDERADIAPGKRTTFQA